MAARAAPPLAGIRWAVLDLSGPYRAAFGAAVPHASQAADPFHVARSGNDAVDEVRRRVHQQTLGHRGRKHDPLYRARKLLVSASEKTTDSGRVRLRGLLDAGDPHGEVRDARKSEIMRARDPSARSVPSGIGVRWAPNGSSGTMHR